MKIGALIPIYNSGALCVEVVRSTQPLVDTLLLIDDGSEPETTRIIDKLVRELGCGLLRHAKNQGKGFALYAGFRKLLEEGCEWVLTLDGDGQHDPAEIPALRGHLDADAVAILIGTRNVAAMPLRSRFGNSITSRLVRALFGHDIPDTQSGYRIYSAAFLRECLPLSYAGRYETETLLLLHAIRKGHRVGVETIRTIYLDGNRISYFRPIQDSVRIMSSLAAVFWRSRFRS